mgnify:CR=1 FL=1
MAQGLSALGGAVMAGPKDDGSLAFADEWLRTRPVAVRDAFAKVPPTTCYKMMGEDGHVRGHYCIYSYEENDDGSITLKVIHLDDSFLHDTVVFGVNLNDMVPCGCRVVSH